MSQTQPLPRVNGGLGRGTCVGCQLDGNCTWGLSHGSTVCDTGAGGAGFIGTVRPESLSDLILRSPPRSGPGILLVLWSHYGN